MSLNINNLKVSVSVNQPKAQGGEGSSTPAEGQEIKKSDPDKLTQDVLEQVMQIMNNKSER